MTLVSVAILSCIAVLCALSLSALLPMQFAIAGSVVFLAMGLLYLNRRAASTYAAIVTRAESVKGVRTGAGDLGLWSDPTQRLTNLSARLVRDLEDSYFKLIHTNIQLLSLKEVGSHIISSLDRKRTVDAVLEYLNRGVGFVEYGLFTWSPDDGFFEGGVRRQTDAGFEWCEQRFALPEVDGVLGRSLAMRRSYLIRDAEAHPLGTLHGEALLPNSDFQSYVVVPLLKTKHPGPIWTKKGCAPESCPANSDADVCDWRQKFADEPDPDYWQGGRFRCWGCTGFPVLGCMLAMDTGRGLPLSKVDLVMLETMAQNVSAVLENARLYEELKHEERFRDHVIGGMSNGLVSVDLDGCITLLNQAGERLSGYDEAVMRGRPSADLITEGSGRDPLRDALKAGRSVRGVEAVLRTTSGTTLPIQLTTSLLRDEHERVYGAIGEFADLSMLKGMQAQIRNLDKLAALGRFTSSIAHEIRNPLAGITAGIQYITKHMSGEEAKHVEFVLAEVDRLNRIINDLFSAGRPLELSLKDTDPVALVERSLRTLQPSFEKHGVRHVHNTQGSIPEIAIDPGRIEQVLINLIQNAVEASPENSVIEIELRVGSSQRPQIADARADSLIISVRDRGDGITDENREKIFEPFFTTKGQGTGLGLYISHHIVEAHGGQIVVESRPGRGSCFLFCLPLGRIRMGGPSETADLARR